MGIGALGYGQVSKRVTFLGTLYNRGLIIWTPTGTIFWRTDPIGCRFEGFAGAVGDLGLAIRFCSGVQRGYATQGSPKISLLLPEGYPSFPKVP